MRLTLPLLRRLALREPDAALLLAPARFTGVTGNIWLLNLRVQVIERGAVCGDVRQERLEAAGLELFSPASPSGDSD